MVRIVRLEGPEGADRQLFDRWAQVYVTAGRHLFGDDHSAWTADQLRQLGRSPDHLRVAWAAVVDGQVRGAVELVMPQRDNPRLATVQLAVDPGSRRQGLGSALLREAEREGAQRGRSAFVAETQWPAQRRDESEGFARAHGYAAAQTALRSTLTLPADRTLMRQLCAARAKGDGSTEAGGVADGYLLRTCWDGIPEAWLAAQAELSRRMSTDAPKGGLRLQEESWDEERVRGEYQRIAAMGRRVVATFAVEQASGQPVGHTQVQVSTDTPRVGYQHDTLVLREHRGHRLGIRLKAATALALMEQSPETELVRTWNAADNAPMLAVNRELGYTTDATLCEWQKVV